jgi:hypothetical protein
MANLYYTNAIGDGVWDNILNWNYAEDGTGANPTEVPWSGADGSTSEFDLVSTGSYSIALIFISIGAGVTGSCYISSLEQQSGSINGGTFYGNVTSTNVGTINAGTFNGTVYGEDSFVINAGTFNGSVSISYYSSIWGTTFTSNVNVGVDCYLNAGTFTGSVSNSGIIYNGTFTGSVSNSGNVNSGTFFGSFYQDPSSGIELNGGTFEVTTATITGGGLINWASLGVLSSGTPFTGIWEGQEWLDGVWVSAYSPPFGTCYFTNANGDGVWDNVLNWNSANDGTGTNPLEIPWSGENGSTSASDLQASTSFPFPEIGVQINASKGSGITGTCSLPFVYMFNVGGEEIFVQSGTWSEGFGLTAGTAITGGTFTGEITNENGKLLGGTFSGDSLVIGDDGQGNTTISLGALSSNTPTYSFPTPASGSDQTIARLLNLPWFINL